MHECLNRQYHDRVTLANEREKPIKFRPLRIFARCLVGEHLRDVDIDKLSIRILIEAADACIADALTLQDCLQCQKCQEELYYFVLRMSINAKTHSILTVLFGRP